MKGSFTKRLLYFVIGSLMLTISIEAGLRARLALFDIHIFDKDGLFYYAPNRQVSPDPTFVTNNYGYFGDPIEMPKPKDVCRIFLAGGSSLTTPALPKIIKEQLTAARPNVRYEIDTAGVPRYTSYHVALSAINHLLPLDPDIIVLYVGINDNVYNTNPKLQGEPPVGLWNWRSCSYSLLYEQLKYYTFDKRFGVTLDFQSTRSETFYEANLRRIIEAAQKQGVRVILVNFTTSAGTTDKKLANIIQMTEGGMKHFWGHLDSTMRGVNAHRAVMDKLAREYHLTIGDLEPVIPKDNKYFRDLAHWTDEGLNKVGQYIAGLIIQ